MPMQYSDEAVETCFQLYLKFNGQHPDRIEQEMQKQWPGWRKQNLYDRGKKEGWITKYGWEAALKVHIQVQSIAHLSTAERIAYQIDAVRDLLFERVMANGSDPNLVYQHQKYCERSIEAHNRLRASRESLHNAGVFWEQILHFLEDIAPDLYRQLISPEVAEPLIARIAAHYGEKIPATD